MNRQAQAAVLFLTGGAILHAALTDLYLRYVKAGLQPLLVAAGMVLIATAIATVWYERQAARVSDGDGDRGGDGDGSQAARTSAGDEPEPEQHHEAAADTDTDTGRAVDAAAEAPVRTADPDDHAHAHAHVHHEPRISWLLVLPLLALILVAPPALGSYSAMRTGTALQKQPWGFADLPAGETIRLNLVDYAGRAAYDHGRSLDHRHIKIAGLLALDRDGTPYLVRMALSCCAADAQPVKIGLTGRIPPVLRPDSWLEVTGTYTAKRTKDPVNDGIIPFLDVTEVKPVKAPRDPYDESWNG
ncbi:TIGR03943 family putative permease subunit [Streptomyces phaeochromogenes]|uniref:TIGR03943 family putative permease subunit n=1 Tax=Streptomyces phaeochromogenes TaxID=1923 RepID=UPI002DDC15F1|nr:TIGR03943 family protein [Streptomyces phaeochromogenes]WRZ31294.1 TIGR03943 family protein [Streptomyces phaeochromogenes]